MSLTRLMNLLGYAGIAAAGVGVVANTALYNVDGGERAVIFDRFKGGIQPFVKGEGTHFMVPWVQKPTIFEVRAQARQIAVQTSSKDLQTVRVALRVLFRPEIDELPVIFKKFGTEYEARFLPTMKEVLKIIVAQYDATELITQRELVSAVCRERLKERADEFHITFDDISITDLQFEKEFTHAVEMKQVAQQEAERARFLVEQAEQEKLAKIIIAEGDSKAAELISKSLESHGVGLIELRKIETAKEIAQTMAKSRNVSYLPGGSNVLLAMGQQ